MEQIFKKKFQESQKRKKKNDVKSSAVQRGRLPSSEDEFEFCTGSDVDVEGVYEGRGLETIQDEGEESDMHESEGGESYNSDTFTRNKRLSKKKMKAISSGKMLHLSDTDDEDPPERVLFKAKSMDSAINGDSGFESPTYRVQILPPTLPHPQNTGTPSKSTNNLEKLEFFGDLPSRVDFTHYAAYPFSYSGGTLQPGNSDITLHVPPGAISPYDSLFFPELSASSMWRPLVVVNTKTCNVAAKGGTVSAHTHISNPTHTHTHSHQ